MHPAPSGDWGLVDNLPDAIVVADAGGRIIYANAQAEVLSGYTRDELTRMVVETLLPEQLRRDHAGFRAAFHQRARVRSMDTGRDLALLRKDGAEVSVDIALSPVITETGPVVVAAIRDTTMRRQVEEGLRQQHFHAVFDRTLDAMVIVDEDFRVVEANPAVCDLLGLSMEQLVGRPVTEFIGSGFDFEQTSRAFLESGVMRGDVPIRRPDGIEREIEFSATANVLPGRHLAILHDVTDRRRSQRELEEGFLLLSKLDEQRRVLLSRLMVAQEEERQRIAADIHDDAIQKMVAVGLRLDTLRDRVEEPELRDALEKVRGAVKVSIEHLRYLIFELRPPRLDRDGLAAAIRESLDVLGAEGGAFEYEIEDGLVTEPKPEARAVAYRIAQEALANVRKHARARRISVALGQSEGGLLIRISDDGVGFASEEAEEYQPGHLGIANMRERAELVGGWLRMESSPGVGTTVGFWLPDDGPDEAGP